MWTERPKWLISTVASRGVMLAELTGAKAALIPHTLLLLMLPSPIWNGYVRYCCISGIYEIYIHVWCTTFDLALCTIEGYNVNPPLITMTYVSMKLKYMQASLEPESLSDGKNKHF